MSGAPFGLDFGAVMTVGAAQSVDTALLSEMLSDAERAILSAHQGDAPMTEED